MEIVRSFSAMTVNGLGKTLFLALLVGLTLIVVSKNDSKNKYFNKQLSDLRTELKHANQENVALVAKIEELSSNNIAKIANMIEESNSAYEAVLHFNATQKATYLGQVNDLRTELQYANQENVALQKELNDAQRQEDVALSVLNTEFTHNNTSNNHDKVNIEALYEQYKCEMDHKNCSSQENGSPTQP